ncbi:MAG TPA: AAA family ATPase, partial [Bacillota bacterium]|nr:AAA family ATPase [Bacillota bacterium]
MRDVERFREAVRTHRRALGRSQIELAHAMGLHPNVLSHKLHGSDGATLNQADVVGIVVTLARWGALTTRTEARELLELMAAANALPATAWATPPLSDLSPLIGRAAERAAVHAALGAARLVTLTGVGGTGKTRLALEVAREAAASGRFAGGVAFVDLAPLGDPALLAPALARALGLVERPAEQPEAQLKRALQACHLLLVTDNMEHLLDEVPLLVRLLAAAPALHILATSRVRLHLSGEHEIRVPPLPLPVPAGVGVPADPVTSEAVQLFVARARAVATWFVPAGAT